MMNIIFSILINYIKMLIACLILLNISNLKENATAGGRKQEN